ncbi:HNH endonuclease [Cellulomonas triticagri]|uniref:HNH endonuclease n=1 Tax=Cellulomonas triticagri TaxID=2483352 RepID=A0A3M2JC26_9CELL|nr:HNH endonuclease [Cellulomonas triticagri]
MTDLVLHRACAGTGSGTGEGGAPGSHVAPSAWELPSASGSSRTSGSSRASGSPGAPGSPGAGRASGARGAPGAAPGSGAAVCGVDVVLDGVPLRDVQPGEVPDDLHTGVRSGARGCGGRRRAPVQVLVTVPLSTLIGEDDEPADLDGYGPVDAATARALAVGGVWRRLVTDPLSGAVLDVGRTRYRPTAAIAEHVLLRDRTCARPGCSTPARACDLDHVLEYHLGPGDPEDCPLGTTCVANLAPLCRRDHRLKSDGGFHLVVVEPGVYDWITPTGHRYRVAPGRDPDGLEGGRDIEHDARAGPPPPF